MRTTKRINVHLRLPRALHARADAVAKEQDVSLNGLIVALLADKLGYDVVPPVADEPSAAGGTPEPPQTDTDNAADVLAQLRALVASPALDAAVAEAA